MTLIAALLFAAVVECEPIDRAYLRQRADILVTFEKDGTVHVWDAEREIKRVVIHTETDEFKDRIITTEVRAVKWNTFLNTTSDVERSWRSENGRWEIVPHYLNKPGWPYEEWALIDQKHDPKSIVAVGTIEQLKLQVADTESRENNDADNDCGL